MRGAQTMVGLMGVVWKRPLLTLIEVAWRWVVGAPLVFLAVRQITASLQARSIDFGVEGAVLSGATFFRPVEGLGILHGVAATIWPAFVPTLQWFVPVFVVCWPLAAAMGRTVWLRRFAPELHPKVAAVFVLMLLRVTKVAGAVALWVGALTLSVMIAITVPAERGGEPSVVLCAALMIFGTLIVFMLWAVTSWVVQAAPLIAMARNVGIVKSIALSIKMPAKARGKLIETNLVMGIVRVGLLVLMVVFDACPVPFASNETQGYLNVWWSIIAVLWLLWSDYFHVIRTASYLKLWQAFDQPRETADAS